MEAEARQARSDVRQERPSLAGDPEVNQLAVQLVGILVRETEQQTEELGDG